MYIVYCSNKKTNIILYTIFYYEQAGNDIRTATYGQQHRLLLLSSIPLSLQQGLSTLPLSI